VPSPIAHLGVGYVIYHVFRGRGPGPACMWPAPLPRLLMATAALSMLADLDAVPGLLTGELPRFHNHATHSLAAAVVTALVVGSVVWWKQRTGFRYWFGVALLSYGAHVLMDFFSPGRGVMLLWPYSVDRFSSPVKLFYGLHWSDGWVSVRHLWTVATELAPILVAILIGCIVQKVLMSRARGDEASVSASRVAPSSGRRIRAEGQMSPRR
jgi:inner membrane protein